MAKVKALKSFAGIVSMHTGEVKDIDDSNIVNDLVSAGYIEEVKEPAKTKTPKKKGDK